MLRFAQHDSAILSHLQRISARQGGRAAHAHRIQCDNPIAVKMECDGFYSNRITTISGWFPVRMVGPQTPAPLEAYRV